MVPGIGFCTSTAWGKGLIAGQGTKIPHAACGGQENKKHNWTPCVILGEERYLRHAAAKAFGVRTTMVRVWIWSLTCWVIEPGPLLAFGFSTDKMMGCTDLQGAFSIFCDPKNRWQLHLQWFTVGFSGLKAVNASSRCRHHVPQLTGQQSCGALSQRRKFNSFKDTIYFFKILTALSLCCSSSWGMCKVSCLVACGVLVPWPGTEPVSPALKGRFLTTGPPGKPQPRILFTQALSEAPMGWANYEFQEQSQSQSTSPCYQAFQFSTPQLKKKIL